MLPENLPEPPPRAVATGRTAHRSRRGNHTNPGEVAVRRDRRGGRTPFPPDREGPAFQPPALLANGTDFIRPPQMLFRAKTHAKKNGGQFSGERLAWTIVPGLRSIHVHPPFGRSNQTTVNRLRPLRRRDLMTLRPLAVAIRARYPILRARFLRCGRNVGFMMFLKKEGQTCPTAGGVSRAGWGGRRTGPGPRGAPGQSNASNRHPS